MIFMGSVDVPDWTRLTATALMRAWVPANLSLPGAVLSMMGCIFFNFDEQDNTRQEQQQRSTRKERQGAGGTMRTPSTLYHSSEDTADFHKLSVLQRKRWSSLHDLRKCSWGISPRQSNGRNTILPPFHKFAGLCSESHISRSGTVWNINGSSYERENAPPYAHAVDVEV